ncbi:hypothetical protein [Pampinifervens florentissimum]|uniref:hypothetical protein n=1 Tax=Pampinifervens florentissimum TaxID=1632019 RepID=UPI0013B47F83|nr:hypothetical protein [Hydrogenobacter sp. T-8]QID33954.1 hypothetical protein G3M65_09280 [Hydrogenobacter sp. T-8]
MLSYEVYKILEEELGREKADKVARILEVILKAIEEKVKEQKPILKAEIKEELTKGLVTKEEFHGELKALRLELERRIDRLEVYLKVLIVLVILGLTLLNPAFLDLIKSIFGSK